MWFTNYSGNSIGRITLTGKAAIFRGPGIDGPTGITTGPDGALWFTNSGNNSIGRITTHGKVSNYT
jgi:virginiamycin B lyase